MTTVKGPAGRVYDLPLRDPEHPAEPEWFEHRENLALLLRWREYDGTDMTPASRVIDEPWHYADEFEQALIWNHEQLYGRAA